MLHMPPTPRIRRRLLAGLAAATTLTLAPLTALAVSAPASAVRPTAASTVTAPAPVQERARRPRKVLLQILALNDFHGQLEPSSSSSSGTINGVPAGGAEYLTTHLRQLRRKAIRNGRASITVAAGDLIGATPLLSAAFHDEPTIETMNKLGLRISSVGNHEFDEGGRELLRMQRGGCLADGDGENNQNSCADHTFRGADFQYLAANVRRRSNGRSIFPAVSVKRYHGVRVAFIGMTLQNTPNIVTKSGVRGLRFTDEVRTANRVARQLNRRGIKSIVVLVHEGGFPADPSAYNSCRGISGPIVDINKGLSPRIDLVVTGHTHQSYKCLLRDPDDNRRLVTSASSLGRLVTDIKLSINRRTGEVIRSSEQATNRVVTRDVRRARSITALINSYNELVQPISSRVIGHLAGGATDVSRTTDESQESPLGNLVADSQRTDPSTVTDGRPAEIAFMNPGGIRSDLTAEAGGAVTFGSAFTVQPFNNYLVSMDMTGRQILALLEQQWSGANAQQPKILQVSGITYTYSGSGAGPYTVEPGSVQVNGEALDEARTYRVVANSFLADGGDAFAAFTEATGKFFGGLDIDALAAYLAAHDPYTPTPTDRISLAP
jgi:5'-nucleotidase